MTKTCAVCRIEKPHEAFARMAKSPDGRQSYCRECSAAYKREKGRTPLTPAQLRRHYLWNRYRLREDDFDALFAAHASVCAICNEPEQTLVGQGTEARRLSVDHDHSCCPGKKSCGKCIRGLLCHRCNLGLGYFQDDPQRLAAAMAYLDKRSASESVAA